MGVNSLQYQDVCNAMIYLYRMVTQDADPLQVLQLDTIHYDDFISIADTTMKGGLDPVINAISQMLSKTIFSIRPYEAKFKILEMDNLQWGNVVRKINYADRTPWTYEETYQGMNHDYNSSWIPNPWVGSEFYAVQSNFYGTATQADSFVVREEALRGAFKGPEEFAGWLNGAMTYMENRHNQFVETLARSAVNAFIMGRYWTDTQASTPPKNYATIHLLSEYNTQTGQSLTTTTVYAPQNFKPFMQWVFGRIAAISDMMTERSEKYQTPLHYTDVNIPLDLPVLRHTPKADQNLLLYAPIQHMSAARALADTYHDSYLKYTNVEFVNYWQNIHNPENVYANTFSWTHWNDGQAAQVTSSDWASGEDGITVSNVFGLLTDRNAVGYMRQNVRVDASPYNAADQSYTLWWHLAGKYVNDFTEKGVLLLLD